MNRVRRMARIASTVLVTFVLLSPVAASPVRAAGIEFGTPTATATFGERIAFSVPVELGVPVDRVDLELTYPGALGPHIFEIDAPSGSGLRELRYDLDLTGGAHINPNTVIRARWVARASDAAVGTVTSPEASVTYLDTTKAWRTISGDLVRLHWYDGGDGFARRALDMGERAVRESAELLGVTESEPIDIFVYGDGDSFQVALGPGTGEFTIGRAILETRTLFGLISPSSIDAPLVRATIPHELAHLVFNTAVSNPFRYPPWWLVEGLAVYLTEGYPASRRVLVEEAVRDGTLFPLEALVGDFPAEPAARFLAYCVGDSAVDYLVRAHGADAMVSLVGAYREGLTDDEAFSVATGQDFGTFQAAWLRELGAGTPVRYGPQPAPAGPLPDGWSGPGQTAGPGPASGTASPPPSHLPVATRAPGPAEPSDGDGGEPLVIGTLLVAAGAIVAVAIVLRRRERAA